jgi:DNA repair exonuclease SbcCD ATPase subunit
MNLSITPSLPVLTISADDAKALRDSLLKQANEVTTITDRLDADDATQVLKALSSFEKEIEEGRTVAKAPILDIGRKIDALGKELCAQVLIEKSRISKAIGAFESAERQKAEDERRRLEAEAAKIAREADKAASLAASKATTEEAKARAVDSVVEKAQTQVANIKAQVVNLAPKKAEGSKLLKKVCFEVTDMQALYKARPEFCVITENGQAIRAILKTSPNLQVPGLRHWVEESLSV